MKIITVIITPEDRNEKLTIDLKNRNGVKFRKSQLIGNQNIF